MKVSEHHVSLEDCLDPDRIVFAEFPFQARCIQMTSVNTGDLLPKSVAICPSLLKASSFDGMIS